MGGIARGNGGLPYTPIKADAVPADTRVVAGGMLGTCFIDHQAIVLQRFEAVCNAFGDDQERGLVSTQHDARHPTLTGATAQVNEDIKYRTCCAVDEFDVVVWRQLEVHAAYNVLVREGVELLLEVEGFAIGLEDAEGKGLGEATPLVRELAQRHELGTWQQFSNELHYRFPIRS